MSVNSSPYYNFYCLWNPDVSSKDLHILGSLLKSCCPWVSKVVLSMKFPVTVHNSSISSSNSLWMLGWNHLVLLTSYCFSVCSTTSSTRFKKILVVNTSEKRESVCNIPSFFHSNHGCSKFIWLPLIPWSSADPRNVFAYFLICFKKD